LTHIGYLKKFSFWWHEQEPEKFNLILEIVLGSVVLDGNADVKKGTREDVTLKFSGVRLLKFGDLQTLSVAQIEVNDVSDHQLEGIKFNVTEEENGLFSFVCRSLHTH
jgi:hypothetical protein